MAHEWWGYWDCIYPSLVYVTLKEFGVVGSDTYTWGIKDFHKCWSGSLAKKRCCLGPAGVINCTSLSALSIWVSFFPRMRGYNKSCPALCKSMDCSMPGLPVHHQLPEFTPTHVYCIGDAIQPSHPLSPLSPSAFNLSQHQGHFKWVCSLHQVAEVLEFQFQRQSYQLIFRTDFL